MREDELETIILGKKHEIQSERGRLSVNKMEQKHSMTFEEYYMKYYSQVYGYILKKISNLQNAEDMTMEVFTVCYEKFEQFDSEKASFQTWLYVIANNKIKNFYRDNKIHAEIDDTIADERNFSNELEEAIQMEFLREQLAIALEQLNETHRKIVIYRYFQDKKSNDIALLMGMTPGNVRIQLKRAIDKLRDYFIKNEIRMD